MIISVVVAAVVAAAAENLVNFESIGGFLLFE